MASHKSLLRFAILLFYVFNTTAISSEEFSCPEVCYCYLSRIYWVTDCTNKNLTYIPLKGLDLDTYILNMNDNFLSELEPYPSSKKVRNLQLSNNLFTEIKNTTFKGFHDILTIDLSNNLISYVEPLSFNDNKGLTTIDLHGNQFAKVNNDPFLTSNVLLNLNLANCRITNISPYFFANIRNLNTLNLSGNAIEEIKSHTFYPLRSLKHLILNDCNITYISVHAFNGLDELLRLELARNKLTSDVNWSLVLRYSSRLEYLDLRKTGVARLSFDTFANNIWLRNLVLAENQLYGPHVGITLGENLVYLDFLDLSNCGINVPISGRAFNHVTKLRTLILSGNHLIFTNLSTVLSPLVNLEKLSLRDCGLNGLKINTFRHLTHLKELDISRNPSINNDGSLISLSILKSLEHLNVSYSNLEQISATIFSNMSNLKTLILNGNKLKFLEQGSLQNLKSLQVLELNNCGLTSLSNILFFNDFPYYPNLVELRISGNPIQTPANLILYKYHMVNLNNLDMSKCNLSYLPQEYFISTPNLKQLLLNDNKLKGDYKNMKFMKHLSNIVELNLNFNNMTSIDPTVFNYNDRLASLKLIGNPWICDCYIVDMWKWAEAVKLHIYVLDGSTGIYSYMNHEKTRYLTCDYDPNISLNMKSEIQSSTIKQPQHANFTWPRFVLDAICLPVTISVFG